MVLLNIAYGLEPLRTMTDADILRFAEAFNAKKRTSNFRQALSLTTGAVADAQI